MKNNLVLVHASNVIGLGASQVIKSLIMAFEHQGHQFDYIGPENISWFEDLGLSEERVKRTKRILPRSVSRFLECLLGGRGFQHYKHVFVLGDVPIKGLSNQVVLVHQANLLSPAVNRFSSKSISFRVMRMLFRSLIRDVRYFIVQSGAMESQLIASYPEIKGKVRVIPQPAPHWLYHVDIKTRVSFKNGLKLFYPAAGYAHKNHGLFLTESDSSPFFSLINELTITLNDNEIKQFHNIPKKIKNIGRVSADRCIKIYSEVDALFYPSLTESYGLPLVEAMTLGLPIICADLPYARWMCGEEAIYFDPEDISSAAIAIDKAAKRLTSGWRPDWTIALNKLPSDWDEVGKSFVGLLQ